MIKETQSIRVVSAADLMHEVKRFSDRNARMIQIGCTQDGAVFELNYSFDVGGTFENIRVLTNGDEVIPSVSDIYLCSFIYENEIHDLYGIAFEGIAVDYKGTLIKTAKLHPFRMDPTEMKVKPKGKAVVKPKKTEESRDSPTFTEETGPKTEVVDADIIEADKTVEVREVEITDTEQKKEDE